MVREETVTRYAAEATDVVINYGEEWEQHMSLAMQWVALTSSLILIIWYTKQTYMRQCGWEEFYVCIVETIKVVFDMNMAFKSPATIYQYTGVYTHWLRYGEWLLTCPVILIHLSNLTGLDGEYSTRSMKLLVSDVGTIVMGVTSAFSRQGYLKVIFFMLGMSYGSVTYFSASQAFIEGYNKVPKGRCRQFVKCMAVCFFGSWVWYPILFMLGPEGFGHLSIAGSDIAHSFVDMISKNTFGIVGHFLRLEIRKHILKHGELKKQPKGAKGIMGMFGFDDLDDMGTEGNLAIGAKTKNSKKTEKQDELNAGVVILGVKDASLIRYFQELFTSLNSQLTLMPAVGAESIKMTVQTLNALSIDYVLLDAELVNDPVLLSFLKAQCGMRVCGFGWAVNSPHREILEQAPLDGVLEGPSFGKGVDANDLKNLTSEMQELKKQVASRIDSAPALGGYVAPNQMGFVPQQQGQMALYGQGYDPQQVHAEAETVHQLLTDIQHLKQELEK